METLGSWLADAARHMESAGLSFGHGTDNAADEAAWMACAVLDLPPAEPLCTDRALTTEEGTRLDKLLARRIGQRRPLAHLLGEAWFCGLRFEVNRHCHVPRSPIAELIAEAYRPWVDPGQVSSVLDLCTGSGAIAVSTALACPDWAVTGSDINADVLDVARRNASSHGVSGRVRLVQSDLFEQLAGQAFDLIVSNPPYVADSVFRSLPNEYHAEPERSLVSPGRGLLIPLRILHQAPRFLSRDGILICEVGENAQALQQGLGSVPLTWIEFAHGGEGVFVADRELLLAHAEDISELMERLRHVA